MELYRSIAITEIEREVMMMIIIIRMMMMMIIIIIIIMMIMMMVVMMSLPVNGDGRDGEGGDEDEDALENNDVGRGDSEGGRRIMAL